jgi:hypothetical protein
LPKNLESKNFNIAKEEINSDKPISSVSIIPVTNTRLGIEVKEKSSSINKDENGKRIPDLTSKIVSWWNFNTDAQDSIGNNHGTLTGDAVITNQELVLDGTGDFVNMGNPQSLQITDDLTISFWVYPENLDAERRNPIHKKYYGEFAITQEPSGQINYYHGPNEGTGQWLGETWDSIFVEKQWLHIAIVRDVSKKNIKLYKDGVDQGPSGANRGWYDIVESSSPFYVGTGYTNAYEGKIDEVMFFNNALSSEEIFAIYNDQKK